MALIFGFRSGRSSGTLLVFIHDFCRDYSSLMTTEVDTMSMMGREGISVMP